MKERDEKGREGRKGQRKRGGELGKGEERKGRG